MAEWQQYPIPLGFGLATGLPQNPEQPRPLRMTGLVPSPGRLYSFQEARVVPHRSEGIRDSDETLAFDHFGLRARVDYRSSGNLYRLETEIDSPSNVAGVYLAASGSRGLAFWEQAGLTGQAVRDGATNTFGSDLNHMLFNQRADAMSLHGSTLSPGLIWSVSTTAATSGGLDDWVVGSESMSVTVAVVRTVSTPGGEFGVSRRQDSESITFSSNKAVTVTVTQTDSYPANYLIYARFRTDSVVDGVGSQESDWLLCATLTGAGSHTITEVPIGETLPGGSGAYLLNPYPGSTAIRHQNRYFAISGSPGGSTPGWPELVAVPLRYTFSLGSVAALTPRRSVVYSAGLSVVNMGTAFTHFTPQLHTSEYITALASSPAGLLIFGQNETLVARGNPDSTDFSVQLVSATVGCDEGVTPARLGGLVFVVHKGRVWAVNLGPGEEGITNVLTDVSAGMAVPDMVVTTSQGTGSVPGTSVVEGGFVDIRADSRHNQLLALRSYNISRDDETLLTEQVYRYDLKTGEWFDDPIMLNGGWDYPGATSAHKWLVYPCSDRYGLRYYPRFNIPPTPDFNDEEAYRPRYLVGRQGGTFALEFQGIDCGKPHVTKQFRRVHVFAQGFGMAADRQMAADPIAFLNDAQPWGRTGPDSPLYVRVEQDARDGSTSRHEWVKVEARRLKRGHWYYDLPPRVVGESITLRIEGQLFSDTVGPSSAYSPGLHIHPTAAALNEGRLLSASYACLDSPIIVDYQDRRQLL